MPIGKYFGGHGREVMSNMQSEYGAKKGKSVFYATANKRNQNPSPGAVDMLSGKGKKKGKK